MNEVYKRKLRYSEAKRHFIYIEKRHRDMFPPSGEIFNVVIPSSYSYYDERLPVTIDKLNRIWAAIFWEKLPHFREEDTIIFSKNPDGSFNVSIEE